MGTITEFMNNKNNKDFTTEEVYYHTVEPQITEKYQPPLKDPLQFKRFDTDIPIEKRVIENISTNIFQGYDYNKVMELGVKDRKKGGDVKTRTGFETLKVEYIMKHISEVFKKLTGKNIYSILGSGGPQPAQIASQIANDSLADVKENAISSWVYGNKMYDRNSPMTNLIAQKLENQYTTNSFRKAMAVSLSITGDQMSASTMFKEANKEDMLYRNDALKYTMAKEVLDDPYANDDSVAAAMDNILSHTMKYGSKQEILAFAQIMSAADTNKTNAMKYMGSRYSNDSRFAQELLKSLTAISIQSSKSGDFDIKRAEEAAEEAKNRRSQGFKTLVLTLKGKNPLSPELKELAKTIADEYLINVDYLIDDGKASEDKEVSIPEKKFESRKTSKVPAL